MELRLEGKNQAYPLPRGMRGAKLENNFSLVQSFKAPNQEFDHSKWLFETKGTYGMEMWCGLKTEEGMRGMSILRSIMGGEIGH